MAKRPQAVLSTLTLTSQLGRLSLCPVDIIQNHYMEIKMQDLNNTITIDGFATDRIETTKVGKTNVTRFTVATNSFRKNKDGEYDQFTEYHTCEAWGSQSKYVSERITKGTK